VKPKILCVDDEPMVLAGLELHLRRHYTMLSASSGVEALEIASRNPDVVLVMSDMRMPGMSGAELLARMRTTLPDATRILLTGHADMESAIAAVNEGHIFRFLTKPCPPEVLGKALAAGVEQNQLILAERVLLEKTLRGAVRALAEVLALSSPAAFGTAKRLESLAGDLARSVDYPAVWQVEIAAVLSQLGVVTLPHEILDKLRAGATLETREAEIVARAPAAAERLVSGIPRLEPVLQIMHAVTNPTRVVPPELSRGAAILRLAVAFDRLESRGAPVLDVISELREQFEADLVDALEYLRGEARGIGPVALKSLEPGMVLAEDLLLSSGALLVPRGYEVTPSFLARLANFTHGAVRGPALVHIRPVTAPGTRVA